MQILHKIHCVELYWHLPPPPEITSLIWSFIFQLLTKWSEWRSSRHRSPSLKLCVFSNSMTLSLLKQNNSLTWGSWASKPEYQPCHCSEAKQLSSSQELTKHKLWQAATEHKLRRPRSNQPTSFRCLFLLRSLKTCAARQPHKLEQFLTEDCSDQSLEGDERLRKWASWLFGRQILVLRIHRFYFSFQKEVSFFYGQSSCPLSAFTTLNTLARKIAVLLASAAHRFSHNGYVKLGWIVTCIHRIVQERWLQPELMHNWFHAYASYKVLALHLKNYLLSSSSKVIHNIRDISSRFDFV